MINTNDNESLDELNAYYDAVEESDLEWREAGVDHDSPLANDVIGQMPESEVETVAYLIESAPARLAIEEK